MNKLIFLGLLLVLASQLKVPTHLQNDPLSGKNFTVTSNALNISELDGMDVSFKNGSVFFYGCNNCRAPYKLGSGNSISVGTWITTREHCARDHDRSLQSLFKNSAKYGLKGNKLTLYNSS